MKLKKAVLLAFVLVLISTALFVCAIGLLDIQVINASPYTNVNVETAYNMITNGSYPDLLVLDVRTKSEYDDGHIYGAVLIPHTELEARTSELAGHENHEIIVYCRTGARSITASEILDSHNFTKVFNMLGGITAWESASHPVWVSTVHNLNTTLNYDTIQAAIDAPQTLNGHTILVDAGTYYENVFVNKAISLVGENPNTTVIDGSKSNATYTPIVRLLGENAKDVRICNFTIRGSSNSWGIEINFEANAWIENNVVTNNSGGIVAVSSHHNTFVNNTVTNNKGEGILFLYSSQNTMRNNSMNGNPYNFGIFESSFNHDIDMSNLINGKPIHYLNNQSNLLINPSSFPNVGYLALINCTNNIVENLNLTNNYNGILLFGTRNSTLRNNVFENNLGGIELIDSSNNTLQSNNVTGSWQGISLTHSQGNRFRENDLVDNQLGFKVNGDSLNDFLQDIDLSNTVNGKFMHYLINRTNLVLDPSTLNNTGYLAIVNGHNVTAESFSLENNELLVAFTQNSSIIGNTITGGEISVAHSSSINLTGNVITNGESGILIHHSTHNMVAKNSIVQNRIYGIYLQASSYNTLFRNDVKRNKNGIWFSDSSNNTIFENNITENTDYGIILVSSSYNKIFHNNFINNAIPRWQAVNSLGVDNRWHSDYPSEGNYWNDYNGTDNDQDGIGNSSYQIRVSPPFNQDRYPLMGMFSDFEATSEYNVQVICNSTVSDFLFEYFTPSEIRVISFNVMGEDGTAGFCRICIPRALMNEPYTVLVNATEVSYNLLPFSNSTHSYLYFTYSHSTQEVIIIPEFSSWISILLILTILTVAIAFYKRRLRKTPNRLNI